MALDGCGLLNADVLFLVLLVTCCCCFVLNSQYGRCCRSWFGCRDLHRHRRRWGVGRTSQFGFQTDGHYQQVKSGGDDIDHAVDADD